jgi:membrane-bound serine protease (ClpP class)
MYLFGNETGGPAVQPALALVTSIFTLGFFWLTIRQAIRAQRTRLSVNPLAVEGKVGEVRTPIDPVGSVYVGGELWTAQAERPIPKGAQVKVVDREGLIVTVELTGVAGEDLASEKGAENG